MKLSEVSKNSVNIQWNPHFLTEPSIFSQKLRKLEPKVLPRSIFPLEQPTLHSMRTYLYTEIGPHAGKGFPDCFCRARQPRYGVVDETEAELKHGGASSA